MFNTTLLIILIEFSNAFPESKVLTKANINFLPDKDMNEEFIPNPKNRSHKALGGICAPYLGWKIFLNEAVWEGYSFCEKREIVFHELGHCILKMRHNKDKTSIMNLSRNDLGKNCSNWEFMKSKMIDSYLKGNYVKIKEF